MKNNTKLILAHLFALVAVVVILTVNQFLGIDLKNGSGDFLPKILLLLIPQMGFVYLFFKSLPLTKKDLTSQAGS